MEYRELLRRQDALEESLLVLQEENRTLMRRQRRWLRGFVLLVLCVLGGGVLMAQSGTSQDFVYSGYLEEGGQGKTEIRKVKLSVWSHATDTGATYQVCAPPTDAAAPAISFVKGRFKIPIIKACRDKLSGDKDYWVQLQVETGPNSGAFHPALARAKLGVVPFAAFSLNANNADTLSNKNLTTIKAEIKATRDAALAALSTTLTNKIVSSFLCKTVRVINNGRQTWTASCPGGVGRWWEEESTLTLAQVQRSKSASPSQIKTSGAVLPTAMYPREPPAM